MSSGSPLYKLSYLCSSSTVVKAVAENFSLGHNKIFIKKNIKNI